MRPARVLVRIDGEREVPHLVRVRVRVRDRVRVRVSTAGSRARRAWGGPA